MGDRPDAFFVAQAGAPGDGAGSAID